MRGPFTPETISVLARSAGFEFTPDRCALLAPQLDWLLSEGDRLTQMDLSKEEPVLVFRLNTATHPSEEEQGRG
jgi:hypothetical protein